MMSEELVDYELFDTSGDLFKVKISKREALALDYGKTSLSGYQLTSVKTCLSCQLICLCCNVDHKRRHRYIQQLKASNANSTKWAEFSNTADTSSASLWEPPGRRGNNYFCAGVFI